MFTPNLYKKVIWLLNHPGYKKNPVRTLFRVLCWELIRVINKPIRFTFDKTIKLLLNPKDGVSRLTYYFDYHEPLEFGFLNSYLKNDMVCIDVGANTGMYSLFMAKRTKEVFAFEPQAEVVRRFQETIIENYISNITIIEKAVSDHSGKVYLSLNNEDSSKSRTFKENNKKSFSNSMDAISLDEFFNDTSISRLDYLKIDAEGAEPFILAGAQKTINRYRPLVQIEMFSNTLDSQNQEPLWVDNFFRSLQYVEYKIDPKTTKLVYGKSWNTIAVPNEKTDSLVLKDLVIR